MLCIAIDYTLYRERSILISMEIQMTSDGIAFMLPVIVVGILFIGMAIAGLAIQIVNFVLRLSQR